MENVDSKAAFALVAVVTVLSSLSLGMNNAFGKYLDKRFGRH